MRHRALGTAALSLLVAASAGLVAAPTAADNHEPPQKDPTSTGFGGAVASVDPEASRVGIEVLEAGGNAVDAAVAAAAALGVTEPFSSGLGGGGFFVYYDAASGEVHTIDGRETAPKKMPHDAFIAPDGEPYPFSPERVTSGVSVGVPGTPATWATALREWGTYDLDAALDPAIELAEEGFVVDQTFHDMVAANEERFEAYTTTPDLFLPGGEPPAVNSTFRNPDLADTYRLLQDKGMRAFYEGDIAKQLVKAVRKPPVSADTDLPVPPGYMRLRDMKKYEALIQAPTHSDYRGLDIYGMAPPSSGGSTVGEILNILEQFEIGAMDDVDALHHYFEASALAYADRAEYLGDEAYVDVPLEDLLSDEFAAERACEIDPDKAAEKPVESQSTADYDGNCETTGETTATGTADTENVETTHLTVADADGNVVSYTLTIEQTGGSGLLLEDRGFLLNNELTDFSAVWEADDPNRIEGGKKPRSSMSPTIVLKDGEPYLALGSPGGSTIITTVTQMLFNYVDRGMSIEEALAAPRATQRNTPTVTTEPEFFTEYGAALAAMGHEFPEPDDFTDEIGAATAIEFGENGLFTAVAEPERRGGGAAYVVDPAS